MGHIVPLLETELTNVIPMWMDAPAREPPRSVINAEEDHPMVSAKCHQTSFLLIQNKNFALIIDKLINISLISIT